MKVLLASHALYQSEFQPEALLGTWAKGVFVFVTLKALHVIPVLGELRLFSFGGLTLTKSRASLLAHALTPTPHLNHHAAPRLRVHALLWAPAPAIWIVTALGMSTVLLSLVSGLCPHPWVRAGLHIHASWLPLVSQHPSHTNHHRLLVGSSA